MAERYQLVTEETNLLLVIERAEADKTDGMPALYKVQPMLSAGWGGTGRVVQASNIRYSRRAAPPLQVLRSGTDNVSLDAVSMSVPSVWRTNRTTAAARVDALASGGMDDFELPAFLRKQTAAQGLAFRPALRAVTDLSLENWLWLMIASTSKQAGGPVKAWVCYLLWLHEHTPHGLRLTLKALALVEEQVKKIDKSAHAVIVQDFEKQQDTT